jgi:hypothetical protein
MKNVITFVYPIRIAVATAQIIAVFLCLIVFNDTDGKTRCRNYRNCLNTIALCGLDNGKSGTVFCRLQALKSNSVMQTNQTIALSSMSEDANLPTALQEAINEFFCYNGTPADIDEKLFSMLESATAGVEEVGLDAKEVLGYLFFYKTDKVLFNQLHSFTAKTNVELCKN